MSPRAAARLETLGFGRVYDYVAGKADWGAAGLPYEPEAPRVGPLADRDVPTCRLDERLSAIRPRLGGWDLCVVVDAERRVLGRLGRRALAREDDPTAEEAMTPGPVTIRPHRRVEPILAWMRERKLTAALVTTSDGRLVGVYRPR